MYWQKCLLTFTLVGNELQYVNLDVHWGQVKNGLLTDPVIPV